MLIPRTNAGAEISEERMEELMAELTAPPNKVRRWLDRMTAENQAKWEAHQENKLSRWLKRMATEDPAVIFPQA